MVQSKFILGDCLEQLKRMEKESVDLIFADPPYNLSGDTSLTVKNGKPVTCDKGEWDKIDNIYGFNLEWIKACKEVLKPSGTLWISGTLHNHPSVGMALKESGYWIINDVIWFKPNATPLLSCNRFAPSTELIWVASKSKKYYFDYELAKKINGGKQMRNLWTISARRHITSHPTEKPEELLYRVISLGSKKNDLILDPFMGSGTSGVVAQKLSRNFIGIELDKEYFEIATDRINKEQNNKMLYREYSDGLFSSLAKEPAFA